MSFSEIHFLSDSIKQNVSVAVFMPEKGPFGSDAKPPYKAVYFLPGYSGDYTSIYTMLSIRKQAELKGIAVVMPNGQNSFYIDHPERNANYSEFIGKELIERTRDMFRLSEKREDTYIAGISMGGYGALLNGMRYKDVFSKIAALSPAADPEILMESPEKGGFGSEEFSYIFGSSEEYKNSPWNLKKIYGDA
nr:acetylesterase [Butyrivibrio sp.]